MNATTTPLWGVGSFRVGDDVVTFPVSKEDNGRDIGGAAKALRSMGVDSHSRVLVVSMLSNAAQYWPVQIGLLMSQAQFSIADASRYDAFRTNMFLRAMHYDVVLGINEDVLDGLDDLPLSYADVFADVPIVAAGAGAHARLRAAGLDPWWWLHLGPVTAVECGTREGAHIDGSEWTVDVADDGELLVSARNERAATVERQRTGVYGSMLTEPCACGRDDVRIVPDEPRS
jgi:hypothetical protein